MDTVVVVDTVVVLMTEASKSWLAINAYWLVPVLTAILTIISVIWNNTRQIKNQNRQTYKPYITVDDISKYEDEFESPYYILKEKSGQKHIPVLLSIKNIGNGVATNVAIEGCNNTKITTGSKGEEYDDD